MFDKNRLLKLFENCHDVTAKSIGHSLLLYADGMCDTKLLNQLLIPAIAEHGPDQIQNVAPTYWMMDAFEADCDDQTIINALFSGRLILLDILSGALYSGDFSNLPQRNTEDSNSESSNFGPRDALTESIVTNVALIRKRLRTNKLYNEQFVLGTRTQTRLSLLYMSDIISNDVLEGVRHRIQEIDIDAVYSGEQLSSLLADNTYSLVPKLGISTRPDLMSESLLAGRFVLLLDGVPVGLIGPVNLSLLLYAAEDVHTPQHYVAFVSLIRLAAILITLFLPGFWISLTAYHQDQIPFPLLATISQASDGTPFNEPLEMLLVLLMFQLFIEAGNRLPSSVGSMLSVVGGLIIGDAAIRSGLSSPATLLIAAISSTSAFVLMSNALGMGAVLIRIYVLLASSFIGMFGFMVSMFSVLLFAATLRSYGIPFLVPISPLRFPDLLYSAVYWPWKKRKRRPKYLNVQDKGKQPEGGDSS